MKIEELLDGQYAITEDGLAVMGLSPRSFSPREGYANVVHLANGIGSFRPDQEVTVVTQKEAFEVASKF